jgi:hypothetical protein
MVERLFGSVAFWPMIVVLGSPVSMSFVLGAARRVRPALAGAPH